MPDDIVFDEEPEYKPLERPSDRSLMARLVYSTGLVHNDRQANHVLIGAATAATAAAVFIFIQTTVAQNQGPLPPLTHDQFKQVQIGTSL